MRKRLLMFLGLVGVSFATQAEVSYMTVELKSGEQYSFLLRDKPVVTYENGDLVVNDDASTSYAINDVKDYHFTESNMTTKVQGNNAPIICVTRVDESTVRISNASPKSAVALVGVNGVAWCRTSIDETGEALVKLPNQPGVYLLSVENQSFKIIRK